MNDLELLHDLNRRHARLEVALSDLKDDLGLLKLRFTRDDSNGAVPPRFPAVRPASQEEPRSTPPPLAAHLVAAAAPPTVAPEPELPQVSPAPQPVPEPESPTSKGAGLELQFGRWLARIGVVFALFTLIFFSVLVHDSLYSHLGPWGKLTVLALVSCSLIGAGLHLEKRDSKLLVYGRTLAGGGMTCLYYTLYGATYVPQLQVISSPLLGGFFLLAWSAGVLILAERRKSELLSVFAISLAYFSSGITPGNGFSMVADLILAATAVILQLRNAWAGLSYLCLIGTYAEFLLQAVVDHAPLDFNCVRALDFWPATFYLTGAWLIFTAPILLSRSPCFAAGRRMAFLCLNNGAWVGLLLVAAQLSAFGHLGQILETTGLVLVAVCAVARLVQADASDLSGAYLAQGLGLLTGGVAIAYSGFTRGLLITIESVFLVAAGAFSRNIILRLGGGATAILGAWYLEGELIVGSPYPVLLTFGGALAMLINAWLARRELWGQPRQVANAQWVAETVAHVLLALGLLSTGIFLHVPDASLAPGLAMAALILTASIYLLPLFELPPLAQGLLIAAQISFLPTLFDDRGGVETSLFAQHQGDENLVAVTTMFLATWWPRQKRVRLGWWLQPLMICFALAMTTFCFDSIYPRVSDQNWMISAALLSLVFLAYGAWSRLWAFTIAGQILLVMSVATFITADPMHAFPWAWWAAAIPIAVVFGTGWIMRKVLPRYVKPGRKDVLRIFARIYEGVALGLLIRWVLGVSPSGETTLALTALGTTFVFGGLHLRSSFGVRSGLVLSAAGIAHYVVAWGGGVGYAFSPMDAAAFALLLAQPAPLRRWGRELISMEEAWIVVLASAAAGWLFVSNSVNAADPHNLTLGWALFALGLTVAGFAANERRQRWCGLGILAAAFVRVGVHDFWVFSDRMKVLTFFALTVICLGLSFLYFKFGDRLKEWL